MHRIHLVGALLALTAIAGGDASALTLRTCGPDPVANTADVLCAPPSGPCDASTVVVSASLSVKDSQCHFDLGGRALRVERTLQVAGAIGALQGHLVVQNAGDVTVAKHGRLKARGDFVRANGAIVSGGEIYLDSAGTIRIAGTLDVSGDSAGMITLFADGDVALERSARIRGNGISSFADFGKRYAYGGWFEARSSTGGVTAHARIQMRGANGGGGGFIFLDAARDIEVQGKQDSSGGESDGGHFETDAGDDVRIARASIDVRSRGGGADAGDIWLFAGLESPNDAVPGGSMTIDSTILDASASANDTGFAGSGGVIDIGAYGRLVVAANVTTRADGATSPENLDGLGGLIFVDAYDYSDDVEEPADIHLGGRISARGGRRGGYGGGLSVIADRDLELDATVDLSGKDEAGVLIAIAGRDLHLGGPLVVEVERPHGNGADVLLKAGERQVGALTVAADVLATGGTAADAGPTVMLWGCPITVADGVTVDASGGVVPGGVPSQLHMISGRPAQLGAGARFLAGPSGHVTATHPPQLTPVIGPGARFDPTLVDVELSASVFPFCPRCGTGPGDDCAPTVRIDAITPGPGVIDATVAVGSPIGLPLSGDVAVCDGTDVEDLTFTWLASTCDTGGAPVELLVNDTVVATIPIELSPQCLCGGGQPGSYTVPFHELQSLLGPGTNRLGFRVATSGRTQIYWAYATLTRNGTPERVPLLSVLRGFEVPGTTHFDETDRCRLASAVYPVDATGEVNLCTEVATVGWSGTLPCGLDVSPLATDRDYTLMVRASDGVVALPSAATHAFSHGSEGILSINGAQCP